MRTPALPAGSLGDVTLTNPDATTGTLSKGWVADFNDVPLEQQFHSFVTTLVSNGITAGVGGGNYGVANSTLRQQMAVFLLKAKFGICYVPPPCAGTFTDVPCPSTFAPWIEALAPLGITGGCGGTNYCPGSPVRRDQMAVFLLKTEHGFDVYPARLRRHLHGRRVPVDLRRLDRAAGRRKHDRRLRRDELLPAKPQHAGTDGRVHRQDVQPPVVRPARPRVTPFPAEMRVWV